MTWRWPWISRVAYDAQQETVVRLLEERERTEVTMKDMQHRYERLVERTVTMRREGYTITEPPELVEPVSPFPAIVEQAIEARAVDPVMERRLRVFAQNQLTVDEPPAVAQMILDGEHVEDFTV